MIVKTTSPILYKGNCPPVNSNFKLTTALPIMKNGVVIENKLAANTLNYASASGFNFPTSTQFSTPTSGGSNAFNFPTPTKFNMPSSNTNSGLPSSNTTTRGGFSWDKVQNILGKAQGLSGIVDAAKGLFGKKPTKQPISRPPQDQQQPPQQGMSTTTKVLIGVGGAVVLGTIIYLITKKK
jgi:hypothetical protein